MADFIDDTEQFQLASTITWVKLLVRLRELRKQVDVIQASASDSNFFAPLSALNWEKLQVEVKALEADINALQAPELVVKRFNLDSTLGWNKLLAALKAIEAAIPSLGVSIPSAPQIIIPPVFLIRPVVGDIISAEAAEFSGLPEPISIVDGWWRGDPAAGGLLIGVETNQNAALAASLAGLGAITLDASDLSSMFQDDAGTIPVTADGQLVRKMIDTSSGTVWTRPSGAIESFIFRDIAGIRWLEKTGPAATLETPFSVAVSAPAFSTFLAVNANSTGDFTNILGVSPTATGIALILNASLRQMRPVAYQTGGAKVINGSVVPLNTNISLGIVYNRAALTLAGYVNGVQDVIVAVANEDLVPATSHQLFIGNTADPLRSFDGKFFGLVMMAAAPTAQQLADIQKWLAARYTGEASDRQVPSLSYDTPIAPDYGKNLAVSLTATNSEGSITSIGLSQKTAWRRQEFWDAGLSEYSTVSVSTAWEIVADVDAPAGNALSLWQNSAVNTGASANIERQLALLSGAESVDILLLIKTPPTAARSFISLQRNLDLLGTGVGFRLNFLYHKRDGDNRDNAGVIFGSYLDNTVYFVRLTVEDNKSIVKVWLPTDPEPLPGQNFYSEIIEVAPFEVGGVVFGNVVATTTANRFKILAWAIGMNTEAPSVGADIIQSGTFDPIQFNAPTEVLTFDTGRGAIIFNVENM